MRAIWSDRMCHQTERLVKDLLPFPTENLDLEYKLLSWGTDIGHNQYHNSLVLIIFPFLLFNHRGRLDKLILNADCKNIQGKTSSPSREIKLSRTSWTKMRLNKRNRQVIRGKTDLRNTTWLFNQHEIRGCLPESLISCFTRTGGVPSQWGCSHSIPKE